MDTDIKENVDPSDNSDLLPVLEELEPDKPLVLSEGIYYLRWRPYDLESLRGHRSDEVASKATSSTESYWKLSTGLEVLRNHTTISPSPVSRIRGDLHRRPPRREGSTPKDNGEGSSNIRRQEPRARTSFNGIGTARRGRSIGRGRRVSTPIPKI